MGIYLSQLFKTFISNHKEFYMNPLETLSHKTTHVMKVFWKLWNDAQTNCATVTSFITVTARE